MSSGPRDLFATVAALESAVANAPLRGIGEEELPAAADHLVLSCHGRRIGVERGAVSEVRTGRRPAPLPQAPDWLTGLDVVGRRAVPVVHLSLLFGWGFESAPWWVFLRHMAGGFALAVGGIEGLTTLRPHLLDSVQGSRSALAGLVGAVDERGPLWLLSAESVAQRLEEIASLAASTTISDSPSSDSPSNGQSSGPSNGPSGGSSS